jgi:enoyl-CoA hydratase/carnithine racemase
MSAPTEPGALVERAGGVLTVTINRPHRRNAIDLDTALLIEAAMDELDDDDELRVGIITGAGGTFCAGMDLKAFAATGQRSRTQRRGAFGITNVPPRKPLIAAVEGHAIGGGFEIALACDLIVAGKSVRFGVPEVARGLTAAGGGLVRLPNRIPYHLAMEAVLTAQPLSAGRCYDLGLVNRLVDDGGALDAARELADVIAANAPLAVAASKQVINTFRDWSTTELFARQAEILDPVQNSADAKEGAAAFAEKRTPVWTGR